MPENFFPNRDPLYIIDGIAPFFLSRFCNSSVVNWSKIPFQLIERNGSLDSTLVPLIIDRFRLYTQRAAEMGFNAISLDDLAHLVPFPFYPQTLRRKIEEYRRLFDTFFSISLSSGLRPFITTDIIFFNKAIERNTAGDDDSLINLFQVAVVELFTRFPSVGGIITRFGESDGRDVRNEFGSTMVLRTADQCRRWLQQLVPVFEQCNRLLLFRTWTLGAYRVGDLLWNAETFHRVFRDIASNNLIISMKYGDADFFRYCDVNPLFFQGTHKKCIELQARREYEGFGEFPSFIGFVYERYREHLRCCETLSGILVWCQTGGWSHFSRLSLLDGKKPWNEINTYVTLRLFRDNCSVVEAVRDYCAHFMPGIPAEQLMHLLYLSDKVVTNLWYIPEFSRQHLYFRRIRVPPLLWVFWDTIMINHTVRQVVRRFVRERAACIDDGYDLLGCIETMKRIAGEIGMDTEMFDFQYETFRIVALAREYFLGDGDEAIRQRISTEVEGYCRRYPDGFRLEVDFSLLHIGKFVLKSVFALCLRSSPSYRRIDTLFLLRMTGWVYPFIKRWERRRLPQFSRKQAMGIQVFFK